MAKPTMNAALRAARKKFAGQSGTVAERPTTTQFPNGKYTARVDKSEITPEGKHEITARIVLGEYKGKLTPRIWTNDLTEVEGALSFGKNMRAILGDVIPIKVVKGESEMQYNDIVDVAEDLAHECIGQIIEVAILDRKAPRNGSNSHLKDDGTPWQNCYINRGLGDDAAGVLAAGEKDTPPQRVSPSQTKVTAKKKVVAKKKVAKKKVVRKRK